MGWTQWVGFLHAGLRLIPHQFFCSPCSRGNADKGLGYLPAVAQPTSGQTRISAQHHLVAPI